jgi:hypothetical protein
VTIDTEARERARVSLEPAARQRRKRIAGLALVLAAALAWIAVWAGAISALYQAVLVMAAVVAAAGGVQLFLGRGTALRIAKGIGFAATTLLIAEGFALALHFVGPKAPLIVEYRDGGRTMFRDSVRFGFRADIDDGAVRAVKRRPDRTVIYDATYTLRGGFRATGGNPDGPCTVVFMIDSFAFGEGVGDADTLPQRFSEATGGRLNVVNLGFSAYGPQQMLAWLESPQLERAVRAPLAAAYYVSIDDHVLRIAGQTPWSRFDPRYALIGGAVTRTGRFHSPPSLASWRQFRLDLSGFLSASSFYHELVRPVLPDLADRVPAARALYIEALSHADAVLRARYGVPLTILVWHSEQLTTPALAELARRGAHILRFDAMVGPLTPEYTIADDGHPTPLANRRWAEALARRFPGCPAR